MKWGGNPSRLTGIRRACLTHHSLPESKKSSMDDLVSWLRVPTSTSGKTCLLGLLSWLKPLHTTSLRGSPKVFALGNAMNTLKDPKSSDPPMLLNATGEGVVVILAFVNQAAVDIRRGLQKIDGLASKSIDALLEVANKVYNRGRPLKTD